MPYPRERHIDTEGFPDLAVKSRTHMMDFMYVIRAFAWSGVMPLSSKAGMFGGFSAFLPDERTGSAAHLSRSVIEL